MIAEARWAEQVRNNLLALHSYFQHRDGAMNSDMDLAVLQKIVVLPQLSLLNCFERTCCDKMGTLPYLKSILGAKKKPLLFKCY